MEIVEMLEVVRWAGIAWLGLGALSWMAVPILERKITLTHIIKLPIFMVFGGLVFVVLIDYGLENSSMKRRSKQK